MSHQTKALAERPRVRMPEGERAFNVTFRLYPSDLEALDRIAASLPAERRSRTAALRYALNFTMTGIWPEEGE